MDGRRFHAWRKTPPTPTPNFNPKPAPSSSSSPLHSTRHFVPVHLTMSSSSYISCPPSPISDNLISSNSSPFAFLHPSLFTPPFLPPSLSLSLAVSPLLASMWYDSLSLPLSHPNMPHRDGLVAPQAPPPHFHCSALSLHNLPRLIHYLLLLFRFASFSFSLSSAVFMASDLKPSISVWTRFDAFKSCSAKRIKTSPFFSFSLFFVFNHVGWVLIRPGIWDLQVCGGGEWDCGGLLVLRDGCFGVGDFEGHHPLAGDLPALVRFRPWSGIRLPAAVRDRGGDGGGAEAVGGGDLQKGEWVLRSGHRLGGDGLRRLPLPRLLGCLLWLPTSLLLHHRLSLLPLILAKYIFHFVCIFCVIMQ